MLSVAAAALLAVAAALFWPAALGGQTTYVVTHGISMEPGFHSDDLAILRSAASYTTGDVAAYHGVTVHTLVMHRIIGGSAAGFDFKGDNNSWVDPDHPAAGAIVGRLWLHIPGGGKYLRMAHSPWVIGAMGLIVMTLTTRPTRRRRRSASTREAASSPPGVRIDRRRVVSAAVALAVAAGAVAALAFAVPETKPATSTVTVTHTPTFSYDAA
ncbi:MAG: hypothetical protein QOF57_2031, partial [Frankiaceae bacterium]|nr:hypothetical protein [Frankiaceae bacterium]